MIHQYKNNGYNIVMDVNSGSVHIVDDVVYDVIPLAEQLVSGGIRDVDTVTAAVEACQKLTYSHDEVREAVEEILELAQDIVIDAQQRLKTPLGENLVFVLADYQLRMVIRSIRCVKLPISDATHPAEHGSDTILVRSIYPCSFDQSQQFIHRLRHSIHILPPS